MSTTQLHTIADLLTIPDSERFELIEEELFAVSPSSFVPSVIAARILGALIAFVDEHDLGYVTGADGGYILERDPDSVVAPDVAFVRRDRFEGSYPRRGFAPIRPDFAVEVLSQTDEPRHIRQKRAVYERAGVPLVWWVDSEAQTVTVRQPGREPLIVERTAVLDGAEVLPGFLLPVSRIFRT